MSKVFFTQSVIIGSLSLLLFAAPAFCDETNPPTRSPLAPWFKSVFGGEKQEVEKAPEPSLGRKILLWLPNRVLDLVDSVKLDLGVGLASGAVLRVTESAQIGYRDMDPASARIGNFGRRAPFLLERSNEFGVGSDLGTDPGRSICPGELGLGLDLLFVGAYLGVCVDEVFDFTLGLVGVDPKEDDLL